MKNNPPREPHSPIPEIDFTGSAIPIDYTELAAWLRSKNATSWLDAFPGILKSGLSPVRYGDLPKWLQLLEQIPTVRPSRCDFYGQALIGEATDIDSEQQLAIKNALRRIMPWRKGPFSLYGIELDAEWRSDLKWNRIKDGISSLKNRAVLDVGCGNGYYMLRMLGQGAERVVGIDPSPRFVVQFEILKKLAGSDLPAHVLPMASEQMPGDSQLFDSAFSMGVLYHRRSPLDHLLELHRALKPGGELILETLVIDAKFGTVLVPEDRYAQMRNVWFIPTVDELQKWLRRSGFHQCELMDVSFTSTEEQRATPWMQFQSLADFLDPKDSSKTVEGYPAPQRAAIRATKN